MKIVNNNPPNFDKIAKTFNLTGKKPVFTYGDTIYNPHGGTIQKHLEIHEETHKEQQGENIEVWWDKYLNDSQFRLEQELEAYGRQYAYARTELSAKNQKVFLNAIAQDLASEMYGNLLTVQEAESKIRNYSK